MLGINFFARGFLYKRITVKKIGIFDSGIGGLSILNKVRHLQIDNIVYYADSANVPYGEKSPDVIFEGTQKAVWHLESLGVDCIIIACHTASTYAFHRLTTKRSIPLIEINIPLIEKVIATTQNNRIGILATRATVNSQIYAHLLYMHDTSMHVIQQACPDFVSLLEQEQVDKAELQKKAFDYCAPLLAHGIDTLVLGCTHYAFLKDIIRATVGDAIHIVSADENIIPLLQQKEGALELSGKPLEEPYIEFITTGDTAEFLKKAQRYLNL